MKFYYNTISLRYIKHLTVQIQTKTSRNKGRFPFDQKFRFEISKISRGKWNSKSGNFPDGFTSPGRPSRSIQFRTEISRNLRQKGTTNRNFFEWNSNFRSERTNRKSGPPQKVDLLFREFSGWPEPFHSVSDRNFRKFWLNGKRPRVNIALAKVP